MKKKSLLKVLTVLFVVCITAFVFTACNNGGTDEGLGGGSEYELNYVGLYKAAQEKGYEGTLDDLIAAVKGEKGEDGKSAYEIYKLYNPDYTGDEEEWIIDLVTGKLAEVSPSEKEYKTFDNIFSGIDYDKGIKIVLDADIQSENKELDSQTGLVYEEGGYYNNSDADLHLVLDAKKYANDLGVDIYYNILENSLGYTASSRASISLMRKESTGWVEYSRGREYWEKESLADGNSYSALFLLAQKYGKQFTSLLNYVDGDGKYYKTDDGYVMSVDLIDWLRSFIANANTVCDNLTDSTTINDVYASLGFEDIINCFDGVKVSELVSDLQNLGIMPSGDVNELLKSAGLPELRRADIDLPDYIKEQILNGATTVLGENMVIGNQTVLGLVKASVGSDLINIQNVKDYAKEYINNEYVKAIIEDVNFLVVDFCCDKNGRLTGCASEFYFEEISDYKGDRFLKRFSKDAWVGSIEIVYGTDLIDASKIIYEESDSNGRYILNETGTGYELLGIIATAAYDEQVQNGGYYHTERSFYYNIPKVFNGKPIVRLTLNSLSFGYNTIIEIPTGVDVGKFINGLYNNHKVSLVIESDFVYNNSYYSINYDGIKDLYLKGTEEDFKDNAFVKNFIADNEYNINNGTKHVYYYSEDSKVGCWYYKVDGDNIYPAIYNSRYDINY